MAVSTPQEESVSKELEEKIKYILKLANVEELDKPLPSFSDLLSYIAKDLKYERRYAIDYYKDNLESKLFEYIKKVLEDRKSKKSNKEKIEAKQKIKVLMKNKLQEAKILLGEEDIRSIVDSSISVFDDIVLLPADVREESYKRSEHRILSVFNPPGQTQGMSA